MNTLLTLFLRVIAGRGPLWVLLLVAVLWGLVALAPVVLREIYGGDTFTASARRLRLPSDITGHGPLPQDRNKSGLVEYNVIYEPTGVETYQELEPITGMSWMPHKPPSQEYTTTYRSHRGETLTLPGGATMTLRALSVGLPSEDHPGKQEHIALQHFDVEGRPLSEEEAETLVGEQVRFYSFDGVSPLLNLTFEISGTPAPTLSQGSHLWDRNTGMSFSAYGQAMNGSVSSPGKTRISITLPYAPWYSAETTAELFMLSGRRIQAQFDPVPGSPVRGSDGISIMTLSDPMTTLTLLAIQERKYGGEEWLHTPEGSLPLEGPLPGPLPIPGEYQIRPSQMLFLFNEDFGIRLTLSRPSQHGHGNNSIGEIVRGVGKVNGAQWEYELKRNGPNKPFGLITFPYAEHEFRVLWDLPPLPGLPPLPSDNILDAQVPYVMLQDEREAMTFAMTALQAHGYPPGAQFGFGFPPGFYPAVYENTTVGEVLQSLRKQIPTNAVALTRENIYFVPPATTRTYWVSWPWRVYQFLMNPRSWLLWALLALVVAKVISLLFAWRLRVHLKGRGWRELSLWQVERLMALAGARAWRLPSYQEAAVIPGVDPEDPRSLARFLAG